LVLSLIYKGELERVVYYFFANLTPPNLPLLKIRGGTEYYFIKRESKGKSFLLILSRVYKGELEKTFPSILFLPKSRRD